ncbi:sarcosine oxidase [Amycolatopsis marina]|uniref:Sarcosine oxidase n=1 Tax=Amycolatopsis marina TaxID=490629 RepID=A0A1I0XWS8_9PSEU|nr:N-methyl-L-tryptophan oxidase [Amycolatopsis marina]SFB05097.1 sarcosine oxidase [Amycolatopsis marina]
MSRPTVGVVGLGTMGAQVLWQLALRGVRATGFETYAPGHARGAAGGETRLFRNFELDDLGYAPVVRRADELWEILQRESGRPLRTKTGVLVMGSPGHRQMRTALRSAEMSGLPYVVYDEDELARRHPEFDVDPGDIGLWDPRGGAIRPELTVAAAADMARRRGATVHTDARVQGIESRRGRVVVVTESGEQVFDRVVVAAGGWTPGLIPALAPTLMVRRLTSAWYFGRKPDYLDSIVPFIRTVPTYCYGLPVPDRTAMKVGLGFENHLAVDDPDTVPRVLRPEELAPFTAMVERYLPGLQRHPMRTETYIETYTEDRHEWIGELRELPGVIALAGFSGHGFKMCPAIGEIGAELAIDGATTLDIGFLRGGTPPTQDAVARGAASAYPVKPTTPGR